MAINIRTGQPRNGKTQYVVKEIFDLIKKNDELENKGLERRKIYCDIDGINESDTPIKLDDVIKPDWRYIWFGEHDDPNKPEGYFCPDYNSVFIFDECHKLQWVRETSGSLSNNPTTISLNEHGHAGHDIYLITQFPQYIHTHIRGLVQSHYHVKRKHGLNRARVYKWDDFQLNPRTDKAIDDAYEVEDFKFKKKYQDAYKSASAHAPIKFSFPKKLLFPIVALIAILISTIYFSKDSIFFKNGEESQQEVTAVQTDAIQTQNQQQLEQINQLRFELEELKAQYLPRHIAILADHEDVRPAMIISSQTSCMAYNRHGEPLLLTDSLCYQMDRHPSMIPKSRQNLQRTSDSLPNVINQPQTNIDYFDSNATSS